jgi:hypothetical protein
MRFIGESILRVLLRSEVMTIFLLAYPFTAVLSASQLDADASQASIHGNSFPTAEPVARQTFIGAKLIGMSYPLVTFDGGKMIRRGVYPSLMLNFGSYTGRDDFGFGFNVWGGGTMMQKSSLLAHSFSQSMFGASVAPRTNLAGFDLQLNFGFQFNDSKLHADLSQVDHKDRISTVSRFVFTGFTVRGLIWGVWLSGLAGDLRSRSEFDFEKERRSVTSNNDVQRWYEAMLGISSESGLYASAGAVFMHKGTMLPIFVAGYRYQLASVHE